MKYDIGKKFYKVGNDGSIRVIQVIDTKYELSGLGGRRYINDEQLRDLIEDNSLVEDVEAIKREKIRRLEEEFGIRLEELRR